MEQEKNKKIGDCWIWPGYKMPSGYGELRVDGKNWLAHRYFWTITHGPITNGLWVLHKCDNPSCFRPDHLFLGTAADNCRDRHEKGRDAKGEKNGSARLTERKVLSAREEYKLGGLTITELSVKYNVSFTTISAAVRGITWKHLGRLHG